MPTNKLWIEHTERAAWESVQALRSELAEAKKRLDRLAPPVEGWPALLEALDVLKDEHALGGKSYAEILRGLIDRVSLSDSRLRTAQETLARSHLPAMPAATTSSVSVRSDAARPSGFSSEFITLARHFVRAMQERYEAMPRREAEACLDDLLDAMAARVDALTGMDDTELTEATVDIAVLALCLHREAKS
jgi:hypothetical protein